MAVHNEFLRPDARSTRFRPLGFRYITMHTGITGITELAVKSDLTNRLPCWRTESVTDLKESRLELGLCLSD